MVTAVNCRVTIEAIKFFPSAILLERSRETQALKPSKHGENEVFELASPSSLKVTSTPKIRFESRGC